MTAGTNPVGTFGITNSTTLGPVAWAAAVDADIAVSARAVDCFAPRPAASPAMSVVIDAGMLVNLAPNGAQSVTEVTQQTVTISAAPGSPNNRIDLLYVDAATGAGGVAAGTPATSPVAPALPAGKLQIGQVSVPNGTSAIGNSNITDLRAVWSAGVPGLPWAVGTGTGDAIVAAYTPAAAALVDGMICAVRSPGANSTTTPTFNRDGLGAKTITKQGGAALVANDIPAALAELILRYNLAHTRWELLNPASASGSFAAITVTGTATIDTLALSNALGVAGGGTGRATLTAKSVLVGAGTSQVGLVAGSAGQVLTVDGSGNPVFSAPSVTGFSLTGETTFSTNISPTSGNFGELLCETGAGVWNVNLPAGSVGAIIIIATAGAGVNVNYGAGGQMWVGGVVQSTVNLSSHQVAMFIWVAAASAWAML